MHFIPTTAPSTSGAQLWRQASLSRRKHACDGPTANIVGLRCAPCRCGISAEPSSNGTERRPTSTIANGRKQGGRQAERELRLAIDTIPALVWTTLPDGSLDFINRRWAEIGLSLDDLRGSAWSAVMHPDERAGVVAKWRTAVETGTPYENVRRVRRADGEYRWFLSRGALLRDESGKIIKWYGVETDIEDQRRAEDAVRRSEAYLTEAQRLSRTGSFGWRPST